jgi:hypothetical protein
MLLDFFEFPLGTELEGQIFESLLEYLYERKISYDFNEDYKILEVHDLDDQTATEIVDNFDIINKKYPSFVDSLSGRLQRLFLKEMVNCSNLVRYKIEELF